MAKPLKTIEPLTELSQKSLLATSHILAAIIVVLIICLLTWDEPASDVIRNIIFATGGIGALYGLIIASKRQDRFEELTHLQHDQRFSEKLSTCLETIAKEDPLSQTAGLSLLEELHQTAGDDRRDLVENIFEQYLISKAHQDFRPLELSSKGAGSEAKRKLVASLIERAFKYFFENTIGEDNSNTIKSLNFGHIRFDDLSIKRQNSFFSCNFKKAPWNNTKCSDKFRFYNCDFGDLSTFQNCHFGDTSFHRCNFENAVFSRSKLEESFFNKCNFYNITFDNCDLSKSRFIFGFHDYEDGKTTNSSQEMSLNLSDISDAVFSFVAWSDDDPRNMRLNIERINLSQEQMDQAIYEENRPPKIFAYKNLAEPCEHPTLILNPSVPMNGPIVMEKNAGDL